MKSLMIATLAALVGMSLPGIASAGGDGGERPPELDVKLPRLSATDQANLDKLRGQRVVVYGKIGRTKDWDGGINFLNFEGGRFVVVCFKKNYGNFKKHPAELYRGKSVEIVGILTSHKGKPQIELVRPSQMLKVEDPKPKPKPENGKEKEKADALEKAGSDKRTVAPIRSPNLIPGPLPRRMRRKSGKSIRAGILKASLPALPSCVRRIWRGCRIRD